MRPWSERITADPWPTVAAIAGAIGGTIAAAWLVIIWWTLPAPFPIAKAVRGRDGRPAAATAAAAAPAVDLRGSFAAFAGAPSASRARWPRFRGGNADNIVAEPVPLAERWPAAGPPVVWSVELGEGHAAPAVCDGRVFVLDYLEAEQADALRCFSLGDGREIWRRWYRVALKRNHGRSRTIPAVDGRFVVSVGPNCHVLCVDMATGDFRWGIDLARDYGATVPLWYTGQCPLIEDGTAILAPGAPGALLLGVDCATGQVRWRTPNPQALKMSHSSLMPMTLAGRRMYVYCATGGIAGVAADGPDRGALLWTSRAWGPAVVAPSPVQVDGDRFFITAGYGGGSALFRIAREGDGYRAVAEIVSSPKEALCCEQQTPIMDRGRLFAVMPKDAGARRKQFVCAAATDPREIRWASGKERLFGLGPFLLADRKFFVLDDDATLTMVRADAGEYVELGRARIFPGTDAWGPLVLVDGRLLLRDATRLVCLDLTAPDR